MLNYIPYEKIRVGDQAEEKIFISEKEVEEFSRLIGDHDSFHVSDEAAALTPFHQRICHGIHLAAYISKVIGTKLPGFGTIYLQQSLFFKKAVYLNEEILVSVKVLEKRGKAVLRMATEIRDQQGEVVLQGEALIQCHRPK